MEIARVWFFVQMTTAIQLGKEREAANLWDKFLERVRSRVSINTFNTWFQPTRLNRADTEVLHVQIPTTVFRQVLTRTYGEIVKAVFHELGVPNMRVQYVCTEEEPVTASPVASGVNVKQSKLDFESSDHQLNLRYTFDTFVVGKSNEFAHAASPAVAATGAAPLSRGRASLTVSDRPSPSWPLKAVMAGWASASLPISTKPNPLDRPVSRSMITWAANSSCKSLSVAP